MDRLQKRKRLIKKLFDEVVKETIGNNTNIPIKFKIEEGYYRGCSGCGMRSDRQGDYIFIDLNLKGMEYQIENGYSNSYYKTRPDRLNRYIINNRHNALRFILYHEVRHAWQKINYTDKWNDVEIREYDADSWALAHIRTRQKKIEIGLKIKLHKKDWILTGFSKCLPLITCKQTGQEQRISDKVLKKFITRT